MSDPLIADEKSNVNDTNSEKKRKEKHSTDQSKKKRKEQKKSKRESKDEQADKSSKRNPPTQTSEETDNEREESEQELVNVPTQPVETSSKARKRNKNKTRSSTPPPPSGETQRKNSLTTRAQPATHPKSTTSKDESESTKQQTKGQTSTKPTGNKKTTEAVENQPQEQPFTVVGGNRNKSAPVKPQPTTNTVAQPLPPRPKETTPPVPVPQANPLPVKSTPTIPAKIADLIKALPSSQAVVTEIMSALDAFALSADELDIIMHKIANKQSVVKQDWSKLQQGQKVDPQAHIGQALDESAKAYGDSLKSNSTKHVHDLTHELQMEKRRNHDLLKEKQDKDREIQILHAQLDSIQQKSDLSNPIQLELKRLTDENLLLTRQVAQQSSSSTSTDASDKRIQVLSEQMKKLSVDNANWEKKATNNEQLLKELQKEKEELARSKEQLTQSLKKIEEKYVDQLQGYQTRIAQLEKDNEQLKREEIIHIEPSTTTDIQTLTVNNEEREQFENEIDRLKRMIETYESQEREWNEWKEKLTKQIQLQENEFQQEIEKVKQQIDESRNNELATKSQEREKHRQLLTDLLSEDLRDQLPSNHQDFDQWLSVYRQIVESNQRNIQQESDALRRENAQLHQNMTDAEKQLKTIEKTVQSKEESLLSELKQKDATIENVRGEKQQLTHDIEHLRQELQTVRANHDAALNELRALKVQLNERILAATTSPSIVAADESFELLKQPSPSLSPIVVDPRSEPFNEIVQSSKEGSIESDHGEISKPAPDSTLS